MDKQEIINKMIQKAELVANIEVKEDKIKDLGLLEFEEIKGNLYFIQETNDLIKQGANCYYRYKIAKPQAKQESSIGEPKTSEKQESLAEQVKEIRIWANNFKKYVDNSLNHYETQVIGSLREELVKTQKELMRVKRQNDEILSEFKENLDLKFKKLEKNLLTKKDEIVTKEKNSVHKQTIKKEAKSEETPKTEEDLPQLPD